MLHLVTTDVTKRDADKCVDNKVTFDVGLDYCTFFPHATLPQTIVILYCDLYQFLTCLTYKTLFKHHLYMPKCPYAFII